METNWINTKRIGRIGVGLALLITGSGLLGMLRTAAQPIAMTSQPAQALPAQAVTGPLDGDYSGAVKMEWTLVGVLSDPLPTPTPPLPDSPAAPDLGSIDLALHVSQSDNAVTGYVDLAKTLVFSVEHTLAGPPVVKTGPNVQGTFDGVNLALTSEKVSMNLNGRAIQRQFSLTGAAVGGNPSIISGQYRETLWGYASQPVTVLGTFTLQRPVFDQNAPDTSNKTPDTVADTATTAQGAAVTINVLANDSDANGDALTVTSVSKPQFGTATTDGQRVTYTPNANFAGEEHFSYFVSDGKGGAAAGSVTITVNGPGGANRAPTAANDTATTMPNNAVTIDVLANDADLDGDALTISIDGPPGHGTATVNSGKVVYTPQADFTGTDSLTYIIVDGKGGTATATVTITVTTQSTGGSGSIYLPLIQR